MAGKTNIKVVENNVKIKEVKKEEESTLEEQLTQQEEGIGFASVRGAMPGQENFEIRGQDVPEFQGAGQELRDETFRETARKYGMNVSNAEAENRRYIMENQPKMIVRDIGWRGPDDLLRAPENNTLGVRGRDISTQGDEMQVRGTEYEVKFQRKKDNW